MKTYEVTYSASLRHTVKVSASNEDEAWKLADEMDSPSDIDDEVWTRVDNGHDWTLENVWEIDNDNA